MPFILFKYVVRFYIGSLFRDTKDLVQCSVGLKRRVNICKISFTDHTICIFCKSFSDNFEFEFHEELSSILVDFFMHFTNSIKLEIFSAFSLLNIIVFCHPSPPPLQKKLIEEKDNKCPTYLNLRN